MSKGPLLPRGYAITNEIIRNRAAEWKKPHPHPSRTKPAEGRRLFLRSKSRAKITLPDVGKWGLEAADEIEQLAIRARKP